MTDLIIGVFSCFSRLLNVLTGGSSDITFSARSHIDGLWTEPVIDALFLWFLNEPDHCRRLWDHEVYRSQITVNRDKERAYVYCSSTQQDLPQ